MKTLKILVATLLLAGIVGCGNNQATASEEDQKNIDRLATEGLVPEGAPKTPAGGNAAPAQAPPNNNAAGVQPP